MTSTKVFRIGRMLAVAGTLALIASTTGCMMITGMFKSRPAPSEFGLGPRRTAGGRLATVQTDAPLVTRRLQTVRLVVTDSAGTGIDGATIRVGGGMPQHGHGLPTQPRVTRSLGNGAYVVEGLRFNMGGWWELRFAIVTPAGRDSVTFNLSL